MYFLCMLYACSLCSRAEIFHRVLSGILLTNAKVKSKNSIAKSHKNSGGY